MKKKPTPIQEVNEAIVRLKAVITYRQTIRDTFEERDAKLARQILEISRERARLRRDAETADEVIADAQKRIASLQASRRQMTLTGSANSQANLSAKERRILRLKKALATIAILEATLEGRDEE